MRKPMLALLAGFLLLAAAMVVYQQDQSHPAEHVEWEVTVLGHDEQKTITYEQLQALPAREGRGGSFSSVGVVTGPYAVKGVLLQDLCDMVGGMEPSDLVLVSAVDNYSMVFDYDQVMHGLATFDPETMREVPDGQARLMLIYEQEGQPLSEEDGKPLRIGAAGELDLLTEGHYWVKWVDRIEILESD